MGKGDKTVKMRRRAQQVRKKRREAAELARAKKGRKSS